MDVFPFRTLVKNIAEVAQTLFFLQLDKLAQDVFLWDTCAQIMLADVDEEAVEGFVAQRMVDESECKLPLPALHGQRHRRQIFPVAIVSDHGSARLSKISVLYVSQKRLGLDRQQLHGLEEVVAEPVVEALLGATVVSIGKGRGEIAGHHFTPIANDMVDQQERQVREHVERSVWQQRHQIGDSVE